MTEAAIAFPILVAAVLVVFATRVPAARVPGVLAAIALGAVPPVALHAWLRFSDALSDRPDVVHPGTALVFFVYSGLAPVVAFVAVGFARQPRCDRARRAVTWLVTACAYAVLAASAYRHARLDPEDYRVELPTEVTLEPGSGYVGVGSIRFAMGYVPWSSGERECVLRIDGRERIEHVLSRGLTTTCAPTRVRLDAKNELAIVEMLPIWSGPPASDVAWRVEGAYSTRDGHMVDLDTHAVGAALRVPREWTIGAGSAVAIALVLLFVAHGLRGRAQMADALVAATHVGAGWFELADGLRVREVAAGALPEGAALVALAPAPVDAYRASAGPRLVCAWSGTKDELVTDPRDVAASLESIALTVAALGAMPAAAALTAMW